jgi:hypothetical protein
MVQVVAVPYEWLEIPASNGTTVEIRILNNSSFTRKSVLWRSSATQPVMGILSRIGAKVIEGDNPKTVTATAGSSIWVLSPTDGQIYCDVNYLGGAPGASSAGYKGSFVTLPVLQAAFPTANPGDFAWVGATKYEWDPVAVAWVDPISEADGIAKSDTAQAGESIAPGQTVYAAGREWLNDTVAAIPVPATITTANMAAATFSDITGTKEDWADPLTVADETALLALSQLSKPYIRVYNANTDEWFMQVSQPPSVIANWQLLSGLPSYLLQDGGDTLTDGGDTLIER